MSGLQISYALTDDWSQRQEVIEKAMKAFGLQLGDTGAGFGKRDLEFYATRNLTLTENQNLEIQLGRWETTFPEFSASFLEDEDDDPDYEIDPAYDPDENDTPETKAWKIAELMKYRELEKALINEKLDELRNP